MRIVLSVCLLLISIPTIFAQEATPKPDLRKDYVLIFSGFSNGAPRSGTWRQENGSLLQRDSSSLAAIYSIPLAQEKNSYLFSFSMKAMGAGWIGGGLHIFSKSSSLQSSYGHGSSFLIWLTRDSAFYRSGNAYLQLYRSDDDLTMIQLASISIVEDISTDLTIDVYYNSDLEILSVSINGDLKLFFSVKNLKTEGTEVAFRALGGPVVFSKFEVYQGTKD
jgi:hypothetical protein